MLVLTRKIDEVIRIGDDIRITVAGISNGKVRIGVDAPAHVPVHRQEIYLRIEAEKAREEIANHASAPGVIGAASSGIAGASAPGFFEKVKQ